MSLLIFHLRKATKDKYSTEYFSDFGKNFVAYLTFYSSSQGGKIFYFLKITLPKEEKYYLQKQPVIFILLNQYSHSPPLFFNSSD